MINKQKFFKLLLLCPEIISLSNDHGFASVILNSALQIMNFHLKLNAEEFFNQALNLNIEWYSNNILNCFAQMLIVDLQILKIPDSLGVL